MVRHLTPRPDAALCAALAADLHAADLRTEPLRLAWGEDADDAFGRGIRGPLLRAIEARSDSLATLARFFVMGLPQPVEAVETALPQVGLSGLESLGLAYVEADVAVPAALIRPQSFVDADGISQWWIASDLDEAALGGALPADHVLGVGGASRTLGELVMPVPVARALDLGTGCGIQALLVARHATQVVATDISARALAYAEINAMLAGVTTIEFRQGSMFEPVAGETFGLVVSNPPFVITPRAEGVPEYEYRDGGLVGDALVEQFVREAPGHLIAGGAAQLLGNWESRAGETGLDRLRSWVPAGVDSWVIERESLSPIAYAELWIRDGGTTPREPEFEALLEAWTDDFAARSVSEIGFGYVLLRKPKDASAPRLVRSEKLAQPISAAGRALRAGVAAHDVLASGLPDRLVVASDVTEARHHMPGAEHPSVIELRQGGGFSRVISVDSLLAGFVGACDGELTIAQIAAALADLFDVPFAELWADLEPRVRALVVDGFLVTDA